MGDPVRLSELIAKLVAEMIVRGDVEVTCLGGKYGSDEVPPEPQFIEDIGEVRLG
jgi:hypothetical protein